MPEQRDDPQSVSKSEGLSRRKIFDTAALASMGVAATSLWTRVASAAPQEKSEETAKGRIANFKYDLENSKGWEGEGGSAKEVTVEEFPVSQSIAGVSMRLKQNYYAPVRRPDAGRAQCRPRTWNSIAIASAKS